MIIKNNIFNNPTNETIKQLVNFYNEGQLSRVVELALSLTKKYPGAYIIWNILGAAHKKLGEVELASEAFKRVTELSPNYADGFNNLGVMLKDQGEFDKALEAFEKAISLKPNYSEAYNNMGNSFTAQKKFDIAIKYFKKAISLNPNYANAFFNLAVVFKDQGKLDEAILAYNKSISLKPDYAEAYNNLGNVFKDKGKLSKSSEAFYKALSIKPDHADAHLNLSFALLNAGKIKEGLDEYEWRFKTNKFKSYERHFSKPLWDGKKNLKGKRILVWCEQGIGDTIAWSSCLPFISSQAKHCILECQQKLVPLLRRSFPNVEVKPENRNLDLDRDDFDYHLPMGSLYRYFIHEIEANDKILSHLVPDPLRVEYWRERLMSLGKGPYIGISWKSSDTSGNRTNNYPPLSEWSPILNIPNVTFINLQYSDYSNDLIKIKDEFGVTVHNFNDLDHFNNIDDVAALCSALDMVVSIQNSVPLISSAVGKPTKVATWKQSSWNNILHKPIGSSIDRFYRNTWEPWDKIFTLMLKDILILKENWSC